jgi:hypothetical protein
MIGRWFGNDGRSSRIGQRFRRRDCAPALTRFFGLCILPFAGHPASLTDWIVVCGNSAGILLYTNLAGGFPDEPEFRPLFARGQLDVPVLLHPAKPVTIDMVKGYEMTSSLGNMFDNTIALTRLIMSGTLDQFPKLKLVCPHLGGTLPYIIGRLDHQTQVLKRGPKYLTRAPSEYLRQVWLDIVTLPLAMRFACDFMGASGCCLRAIIRGIRPELILKSFEASPCRQGSGADSVFRCESAVWAVTGLQLEASNETSQFPTDTAQRDDALQQDMLLT